MEAIAQGHYIIISQLAGCHGQFQLAAVAEVVLDPNSIGAGTFHIVEVEEVEAVEPVVRVPDGVHPPVDALPAKCHLPLAAVPVHLCTIESGVADQLILFQPVEGEVHQSLVGFEEICVTGNEGNVIAGEEAVAHLESHGRLLSDLQLLVDAVVDDVETVGIVGYVVEGEGG